MLKRSRKSTGQSYEGYKSNVMQSINWVVGFMELIFMVGVIYGPALWIQIVSMILVVVVMTLYFGSYFYWMIYEPDRLQSEGYNLEINVLSDSHETIKVEKQEPTIKVSERN